MPDPGFVCQRYVVSHRNKEKYELLRFVRFILKSLVYISASITSAEEEPVDDEFIAHRFRPYVFSKHERSASFGTYSKLEEVCSWWVEWEA